MQVFGFIIKFTKLIYKSMQIRVHSENNFTTLF